MGSTFAQAGDGYKPGYNTGRCAERRRVAVTNAFGDEPADHGCCRGGCQGVDPDQARLFRGGCSAAVETEPAEPENRSAEHHERDVVGGAVVRVLAESAAVTDDEDQNECRDTRVDVDYGAAGKVDGRAEGLANGAFGTEQAAAPPDHVGQRAVNQGDPDRNEDAPGAELGAVCDCAADKATVMMAKVAA